MNKYQIFWLISGVLLLLAELAVPGFILFFFGSAALILIALLALFPDLIEIFWLQLIIWIVLSVILLYFLRNHFSGTFQGRKYHNRMEDMLGNEAVAVEKIGEDEPGRIKYYGTTWKAYSLNGEIKEGANVLLDKLSEDESMTFLVKKI